MDEFNKVKICCGQRNVEAVFIGADGSPLDEIYHLREMKQNALVDNAEEEGIKQKRLQWSSNLVQA